jgi:hypothetical protein
MHAAAFAPCNLQIETGSLRRFAYNAGEKIVSKSTGF